MTAVINTGDIHGTFLHVCTYTTFPCLLCTWMPARSRIIPNSTGPMLAIHILASATAHHPNHSASLRYNTQTSRHAVQCAKSSGIMRGAILVLPQSIRIPLPKSWFGSPFMAKARPVLPPSRVGSFRREWLPSVTFHGQSIEAASPLACSCRPLGCILGMRGGDRDSQTTMVSGPSLQPTCQAMPCGTRREDATLGCNRVG